MYRKQQTKSKLLKDLSMFGSFMSVAGFVYFMHVFQNEPSIRGYLGAAALLCSYVFQFQDYDIRMKHLWSCFFAWVVYSSVYYDPRTHCYGLYRLTRHVVFAFFPLAAATKQLHTSRVKKALFWCLVAVGPDISSNVYGNALFSIIRIFACTIVIMTRVQDKEQESSLEEFVWVFFCHEILLSVVVLQLLFDFLPIELVSHWPFVRRHSHSALPSDVIGEKDVPFLDRSGRGVIIGAKRMSP
jgi:hypothetical protein